MNALSVFTYTDERQIRTVDREGEIWFVASDVSAILGYRDAHNLARRLDEDEKGTHSVSTPGGTQSVTVISEPGLYAAILGSQVDGATAFKRWVKHEVLPQIRRTGSYALPTAISFEDASADLVIAKALVMAQAKIDEAAARVAELEAPAAAWNSLANADGDYTVSDAAKILARDGIATGRDKLYAWLEQQRWIFRRGGRWQAYQTAVNAGLLVERINPFTDPRTQEQRLAAPQIRVTPKGLERLRQRLSEQRSLALVEDGA